MLNGAGRQPVIVNAHRGKSWLIFADSLWNIVSCDVTHWNQILFAFFEKKYEENLPPAIPYRKYRGLAATIMIDSDVLLGFGFPLVKNDKWRLF